MLKYNDIKKDLILCLEKRGTASADIPHVNSFDFDIVVKILCDDHYVTVDQDMIAAWDISEEKLFYDAVTAIRAIIEDLDVPEIKHIMVTNEDERFGASVIFASKDARRYVSALLGGDFYVAIVTEDAAICVEDNREFISKLLMSRKQTAQDNTLLTDKIWFFSVKDNVFREVSLNRPAQQAKKSFFSFLKR